MQEQIKKLEEIILSGKVTELAVKTNAFGGADILVTKKKPQKVNSFYPDPIFVITKYYKEVSWLIFQLKEIFSDKLNFENKYDFYGLIAETANQSIAEKGDILDSILLDIIGRIKTFS